MSLVLNGTTGVNKVQDGAVVASDLNGNQTGDAPIYGCRAWVNFDGTRNVTDTGASTIGQPVKIRASGNVASVTKNAVGDYTVNFITAMEDVNYSTLIASGALNNIMNSSINTNIYSTTQVEVRSWNDITLADQVIFSVTVFR